MKPFTKTPSEGINDHPRLNSSTSRQTVKRSIMNFLKLLILFGSIGIAYSANAQKNAEVKDSCKYELDQLKQDKLSLENLNESLQKQLSNAKAIENENIRLKDKNKELSDTIRNQSNRIKDFEKEVAELNRNLTGYNNLKEEYNSLQQSANNLKNDNKYLNDENERQKTENDSLRQSINSLQNKLITFQGFANDAFEKLKKDVQNLLNMSPDNPEALRKPVELQAMVALLKGVHDKQAELNNLATQITNFEQAVQAIDKARKALADHYDKDKVQAANSDLSRISPSIPEGSPVIQTKNNLIHYLKHYCVCYLEAYSYFGVMIGYTTITDSDLTQFEHYEYKGSKPPIPISSTYPIIKTELDKLRSMPVKQRKLTANPFKKVTCP